MLVQVSEHCWVRQSSFCQSNTVVVRGDGGVLVVDPGVTGAELRSLAEELRSLGFSPVVGFSTHPHWDHMLWSRELGDPPRLATVDAVAHARASLTDAREKAGRLAPGNDLALVGLLDALPRDADSLDWPGPDVHVLHHRGHAPGHAALFVPADGVLVAGDMLSDVEVPLLDLKSGATDPLADYEQGLDVLEQVLDQGCRALVPGHGAVAADEGVRSRFHADRAYLDAVRRPSPVRDHRLDPGADYGPDWLIPEHEAQRSWCLAHDGG
ncbi:MAG: fold metallo-hydrolase [Ornithinibacter sp.]|nr:fold metallo-hydrolase [Ornithinibacter sp.]